MELKTGIARKLSVYSEQEAYDSQAKALIGEKKNILENEYGIKMTKEIEGRLESMCNLGEGIYEQGIEQTRVSIVKRMYDKGYSITDIAEIIGENECDVERVLEGLFMPV